MTKYEADEILDLTAEKAKKISDGDKLKGLSQILLGIHEAAKKGATEIHYYESIPFLVVEELKNRGFEVRDLGHEDPRDMDDLFLISWDHEQNQD